MRYWKKIVLSIVGLIVLVIGGGYIYLFPMGGLERNVSAKLNALLAKRTGFQVSIGAIKGDVVNQIILEDVVVTYRDSLTTFETINARRIIASYSFTNLWHQNLRFSLIEVDSLNLHLRKDSLGRFLPKFATSKDTSGSGQPLAFFIGTFLLNDAGLDYTTPTDTISARHLSLEASFLIEEGTYALDIKRLQMVAQRPQMIVKEGGGKLTFSGQNLYFENLHVLADSTRLNLTGLIDVKQKLGSVELVADNVDLASAQKFGAPELSGLVNIKGNVRRDTAGFGGQLEIAGTFLVTKLNDIRTSFHLVDKQLFLDTVYGTWFDSSRLAGRGRIDFGATPEAYSAEADIRKFNLLRLVPNSYTSQLSGHVVLQGQSFRNRDLSLLITSDVTESSFDEYPIQEAHGTVHVTTDSIRFLDSCAVRYYENWLFAKGKVEYSGQMDLHVIGDLPRLDRYEDQFFVKKPSGRCRGDWTIIGRSSDPSVRGSVASDSLWLYGLYTTGFSADMDIARFFSAPKGEVRCRFANGTAWDIPYDSLHLGVRIDSGHVLIDSLFSENKYSTISGRGNLDYAVYPSHLRMDTLRWTLFDQQFYNHNEITINIDSAGYDFRQATITDGRGRLTLSGRVNYDETLGASILLQNAQVTPWVHLFRSEWPVAALASCQINLRGDLDHPAFAGTGSLDSLVYNNLRLGDLSFGVQYADRKMTIDSLIVLSQPGVYRAEGSFFVDLALTQRVKQRLPQLPMSLKITMSDRRFDLVSLFLPSVEDVQGKFFAEFQLTGTPSEPHLDGRARLDSGRLKYFDLVDTLYADSAVVEMNDNQITFDRVQTYVLDKKNSNRRSYAILDGGLIVKSLDSLYYDVDVSLPKEFPFRYELDDIVGKVEGEMTVEGYNAPEVTGNLRMLSMLYRVDFATANEGSPLMQALSTDNSWNLNLNIEIPSNYWIKNSDVDAEFSGSINMIREKGNYRFVGELTFLRGKGFWFDKTFRIDPDSRVTFEDIEYLNPRLDITAWTRIPGQRREGDSTREDIDLCMHVTGTLELPQIDPCAGSQFSQQDILPLIVANYYSSDSAAATGQFGERLTDLLTSRVSQIGAKQLGRIGVETFEIDPTYGGELDPLKSRVTFGFSAVPNFYTYFRGGFGQKGQQVGFEYRLNKSFLIEGQKDENELYQLNLKLHWEL